ncbi:MAG TPA: hypothetical protein VF011_12200 [Terriglobales bacterium]
MRVTTIRLAVLAFVLGLGLAICVAETPAKDTPDQSKPHYGFPTDWSSRQLVLSGNSATAALNAGQKEPRHVYNMVRRMAAVEHRRRHHHRRDEHHAMKVDWAVSLENGFVLPSQYPAKYSFQIASQDCNNDYVLYAVSVLAGKPAQGTVIGINNLYTGGTTPCNGGSPWVAFAYNTVTQAGGQIQTSPVPSTDGTKVAFIESTSTGSYFHVLVLPNPIPAPPLHTGTVLAPQLPTSCAAPTTAGCMTTLQVSTASDSLASPWVDYNTDSAYVGTDDGNLYKISPVFGGATPQLVNDSNWPVTVVTAGTSKVLASPVVDDVANRIFLGDNNGFLYAVDLTSPAHAVSATKTIGWVGHGAGTAIVDPPLVVNDAANAAVDQVFAFTGCSNVIGLGGAVSQIPANFTSSTTYNAVGLGGNNSSSTCTGSNAHMGMVDNAFWNSGSASGHLLACGFASGNFPKMFMFGFDVNHLLTSTNAVTWKIDNTKGEECSPLTEFYDGTTDRVFFGTGNSTVGFIKASSITAGLPQASTCTNGSPTATCVTTPAGLGGTSGVIIDNQVSNGGTNIYFSTVAPGDVNGTNCNVTGGAATPYCAVKLTQSALQ